MTNLEAKKWIDRLQKTIKNKYEPWPEINAALNISKENLVHTDLIKKFEKTGKEQFTLEEIKQIINA